MADKVFTMRIDEELLEKVRLNADKNKRSVAKEIEYILDIYFTNEKFANAQPPENAYNSEEVDKLMTKLAELVNKYGAISGKILSSDT